MSKFKSLVNLVEEAAYWKCGDCNNTYGPDVTSCPNDFIHEFEMLKKD